MIRRLLLDRSASSAAEFAMVLPLLLLLIFGLIDAGRFMWEYNRNEKATQAGARFAVVTDPVASGLTTTGFVGVSGLTQGDLIPASMLPTVTCTETSCACASCPAGIPGTFDSAAFAKIVTRMQAMNPRIQASNVEVKYSGSGLGFAGDPNGSDISPLVTVSIIGMNFNPVTGFRIGQLPMPTFSTTLTSEDLSGVQSN
jgi:Flp pilus assembly protein TadG